jgi:hypothetical protein
VGAIDVRSSITHILQRVWYFAFQKIIISGVIVAGLFVHSEKAGLKKVILRLSASQNFCRSLARVLQKIIDVDF